MALTLNIVICSTRPGRIGPAIATWFHQVAREHGKFDAVLVDIADFDLPVFDEPKHPRLQQYEHDHTRRWAASVSAGDAYVFVTPEYNYYAPPAFVNALDYLSLEWNYKPASFVSYGGVSGGLRAAQSEKLLLAALKMMPLEGVPIPMVGSFLGEDGVFKANEHHIGGANLLLDELHKWAEALKPMRG